METVDIMSKFNEELYEHYRYHRKMSKVESVTVVMQQKDDFSDMEE